LAPPADGQKAASAEVCEDASMQLGAAHAGALPQPRRASPSPRKEKGAGRCTEGMRRVMQTVRQARRSSRSTSRPKRPSAAERQEEEHEELLAAVAAKAAHATPASWSLEGSTQHPSMEERSRRPSHEAVGSFVAQADLPTVHEAHIPKLPLGPVARELLADDWKDGSLFCELFSMLGATEVKISPWQEQGGDAEDLPKDCIARTRSVSMRVPLPVVPFCPRSTRQTVLYRVAVQPSADRRSEASVYIDSTGLSHDVPFGDRFVVQERILLRPSADGCGVDALQAGRCYFLESIGLLQSRIEATTVNGLKRTGGHLVTLLQGRVSKPTEAPAKCEVLQQALEPKAYSKPLDAQLQPNATQSAKQNTAWVRGCKNLRTRSKSLANSGRQLRVALLLPRPPRVTQALWRRLRRGQSKNLAN